MLGLAIDSTEISAAIFTDGGDFVCSRQCKTPTDSYRDCLIATRDIVNAITQESGFTGPAGIALPGTQRHDRIESASLSYMNGKNVAGDLQASLGRAVRIGNIGDCFTRSHAISLGTPSLVFGMVIDSHCHGGIVSDGVVITGRNGIAGNWAHLPLPSPVPYELDGQDCWCGRTGCLETFLSSTGLEEDYFKITETRLSSAEIAAAAANNDIVAESALQVLEDRLGRATAAIINIIDPDVIVLGGLVGELSRLEASVPRKWPGYVLAPKPETKLICTKQSTNAVLHGAALLV